MHPIERARLSILIITLVPVLVWTRVAKTMVEKTNPPIKGYWNLLIHTLDHPLLFGATLGAFALAILLVVLIARAGKSEFTGAKFSKFLRGTQVTSKRALASKCRSRKEQQVVIAGVPMPTEIETLHLLMAGATGTGKSVGFAELAFSALMRGDRAIIVDANAALYTRFGRPRDTVLNPYDLRSPGWNFFNEIRNDYDYQRYALSVVGQGNTPADEEWYGYARLLFSETARKLALTGKANIDQLFRYTTIVDPKELHAFLKGTTAESLFTGADRALASARFILSKKLSEHVRMPEGDFSLRAWLEDPKAGNLFIPWREDMQAALRPLITAWIDILCASILSLPEDPNRRLWMLLDELASLEKLPTLEDTLTKGRKHGVRVVAALQAVSQFRTIYGHDAAMTLLSCFRSTLVLGGSRIDADTCDYMSRALGTHEVERDRHSRSNSSGAKGEGWGTSDEHKEERLVLASQIAGLPPLSGYLAFAGDRPIARVKLAIQPFAERNPGFVERVA